MRWRVPKIWDRETCWIIGGGPSIPVQFGVPKEVISGVQNKSLPVSAYSPYMQAIHDKHVIGVNAAYLIGNWIDIVFFGDRRWYFDNREQLTHFPGLKVSCSPVLKDKKYKTENVKMMGRDSKGRGISDNPETVSWNSNSGAAAISLAVHTGANRIILLGFDMTLSTDGNQHWHQLYKPAGDRRNAKKLPFGRHMIGFEMIAKDAKRKRVKIINASPDSAITQFEKTTVNELLNGSP
jgi:hypothetical protein